MQIEKKRRSYRSLRRKKLRKQRKNLIGRLLMENRQGI